MQISSTQDPESIEVYNHLTIVYDDRAAVALFQAILWSTASAEQRQETYNEHHEHHEHHN